MSKEKLLRTLYFRSWRAYHRLKFKLRINCFLQRYTFKYFKRYCKEGHYIGDVAYNWDLTIKDIKYSKALKEKGMVFYTVDHTKVAHGYVSCPICKEELKKDTIIYHEGNYLQHGLGEELKDRIK